MLKIKTIFLVVLLILGARLYAKPKLQQVFLGDFKLENKAVLRNCRIAYRTFGRMNPGKNNVVLFPTWFGGKTGDAASFLGSGKLVDSSKYFIIVAGAFGNGESSSPSNSVLQPQEKFPRFTIADMVRAQHLFLTKSFRLRHIFAVVGGSMGGMQTFEWLARYPAYMEKAVPYVGTPHISLSDRLLLSIQLNLIRMGQRSRCPAGSLRGLLHELTYFTAHTTTYLNAHTKPGKLNALLRDWYSGKKNDFSLNDYAAQVQAMLSHNIFKNYNDSPAQTAAHIKARVLVVVSQSDQIVNPRAALRFAKRIKAQTFIVPGNGGHLAISAHLAEVSQAIAKFLEQ